VDVKNGKFPTDFDDLKFEEALPMKKTIDFNLKSMDKFRTVNNSPISS
jgi:hypothetical protein